MKTRKIERITNWNKKLGGTIDVLGSGDVYAMNTFRNLPRDKQVKFMSDLRCMLDAPKKSVVWNLVSGILGIGFEEEVSNVYNYGKLIIRLQNVGA